MPLFLTHRSKSGASGEVPPPFRLDHGEAIVGRGADAQLVLANPMVSRRHCVVSGEGSDWRLVDTSTAGTLVNGQPATGAHPLRDGDVLTIIDIELDVAIQDDGRQRTSSGQRLNLDSWERALPAAAPSVGDTRERTQQRIGMPLANRSEPAAQFLQAAGLARAPIAASDQEVFTAAGAILRESIAGLSAMTRTRLKARTDLGVERASPAAGPLEAGSSPEDALARLMAMPTATAAEAVIAACRDLEAHERAMLGAMQAAFATALDRFAPESIRQHADSDAAAWQAYEQAFGGAEGFVEVFTEALAEAYRKI